MPGARAIARIGLVAGKDFDAGKLKGDTVDLVPKIGVDRIMLQFKINKDVQGHQRLGVHDQDRPLRHELPEPRAGDGDRAGRQPAAGRGLSDFERSRRHGTRL